MPPPAGDLIESDPESKGSRARVTVSGTFVAATESVVADLDRDPRREK